MPRVTVLVPAYNARATLAEALRSVEAQTYADWEIVLADDGSTDSTVAIAAGFGERVRIVRNDVNRGVGAALALAVEHAEGELLAILGADDYWLPEYLERQVALYDERQARHGNVGIVACNARRLAPDGFLPGTYQDVVGFPDGVTLTQLLRANRIFGSALVPRHVVDEAGGYALDRSYTEDIDLWFRIVECGYRVVATREPLVVYRLSSTSVTANVARTARSKQETYRRALARGNLSWWQRRIAHQGIRLQRALETNERIAAERRAGRLPFGRVARALPLFAVVVLENPHRWAGLARAVLDGRRPGMRRMSARR